MTPIRTLAIRLLDDDHGITSGAWLILADMLKTEGNNDDLMDLVEATDNRVYLPESSVSALNAPNEE